MRSQRSRAFDGEAEPSRKLSRYARSSLSRRVGVRLVPNDVTSTTRVSPDASGSVAGPLESRVPGVREVPESAGDPSRNGLVASVDRSTAGRSYGVIAARDRLRTDGTDGVEVGSETSGVVSTRGVDGDVRDVVRAPLDRGATRIGVEEDERGVELRTERLDAPDDRDDVREEPAEDDGVREDDERAEDARDDREEPDDEAPDERDDPDDPDDLEAPDDRDAPREGVAEDPRLEPDEEDEEAPFLPPRTRECETPFFPGREVRVRSTEDGSPRAADDPFFPPGEGGEATPSAATSRSAAPARDARTRRETGRSRLGIAVLREAARGRSHLRATDESGPGFREL
ncbi:MAG: hypothetical protein ACF8XB_08165 [Planctomycetota bacterium JB042]